MADAAKHLEVAMLRNWNVTPALSLVLLIGACSTAPDRAAPLPDDLKQDLAAAAASGGDLATTPQSYQPMRFVSTVERSRTATPTKRPAMAHRRVKATHSRHPAPEVASDTPDPVSTMVSEAPAPVSTPEAPTSEPVVVAHQPEDPGTAPAAVPMGSGGEPGAGDRGRGGWGGILGGLIGAAVIRGGIGSVDKCDPRRDGRRPIIIDRPDLGLPSGIGQLPGVGRTTFPGRRRG